MNLKITIILFIICHSINLLADNFINIAPHVKGCITSAGSITEKIIYACTEDSFSFKNIDVILEPDDTIRYIICSKNIPELNNILSFSSIPKMAFDSAKMNPFNYYYLFAVVGNKNASGLGIDINDPCISISKPVIVQFFYTPHFVLFPMDTVLECGKFSLRIAYAVLDLVFESQIAKYWSTTDGNIVSIDSGYINRPSIIIDKNGTYTLKIVSKLPGCSITNDYTVNIQNEPPILKLNHKEKIGCVVSELKLDANISSNGDPITIKWTSSNGNIISGDDMLSPLVNKAGFYYIKIIDLKNGCEVFDSVEVIQIEKLSIEDLISDGPACYGKKDGFISIGNINGGVPPYNFSLNKNSVSSASIKNLESGNYQFDIQDSFGCKFDTIISLDTPLPLDINLGEDITVNWGQNVKLNANLNTKLNKLDTLLWFNIDSASCDFCLEPEFIAKQSGVIKVKAFKRSCIVQDELRLIVKKPRNVFIPNTFSPNGDGINDKFVIFGGQNVERVKKFEVFDRWGSRVFNAENFYPDGTQGGWNGKRNDQYINESVFVYYALIKFTDGDTEVYKGDITLIK
ncbi:MAG TPA: gliding motility-associated C-terminal domain-containing protein [Saprospiraceae bacterium]|nr:gliding motility-associated C-terminal domain-containing protein [Saprospiraceae bacterium]